MGLMQSIDSGAYDAQMWLAIGIILILCWIAERVIKR